MQLHLAFSEPIVGRVHNPNQSISFLKVVSPIGADSLLTTNIPNVEVIRVVNQRLDIKTKGRGNLGDILAGDSFQDGGLSGVIQAPSYCNLQQKDTDLALFGLDLF